MSLRACEKHEPERGAVWSSASALTEDKQEGTRARGGGESPMYMSTKQIGVPSMYGGVPTGKYGRVRKRRHGREQSEEGMKIPPLVEANGGGGTDVSAWTASGAADIHQHQPTATLSAVRLKGYLSPLLAGGSAYPAPG